MSRELPPDVDVEYQLARLVRQVRARSMRELPSIHERLDYSTFVLLLAVADSRDGTRAADLADSMHVHKSTVSRALRSLEDMGLVVRTPDPDDGRSQVVQATPDAQERVREYRERSHRALMVALADWVPAEMVAFSRQLGRLNARFAAPDSHHG